MDLSASHLRTLEHPQLTYWSFPNLAANSAIAMPPDPPGATSLAWTHFPPSPSIVDEQHACNDTANALMRRKLPCTLWSHVLQVEKLLRAFPLVIGRYRPIFNEPLLGLHPGNGFMGFLRLLGLDEPSCFNPARETLHQDRKCACVSDVKTPCRGLNPGALVVRVPTLVFRRAPNPYEVYLRTVRIPAIPDNNAKSKQQREGACPGRQATHHVTQEVYQVRKSHGRRY
jgi:hypothetical protein